MSEILKNFNYWQGERIRLRAIEAEDWETFYQWNSDSETARACYFIPFPQSRASERKWATEKTAEESKNDLFYFVIESLSGDLIGTINTHTCNQRNRTFMYGIAILADHRCKGYASETIQLVLKYYFEELGYQKVTVQIYAFNEASIKLHEKLGFQREGCLRRMIYTGGIYHDEMIYGLTVDEFIERKKSN